MTIAGIVLAVVALALSILFFRWADAQAKDSERALVELRAATQSLDRLVAGLRDESFALLRSAYSDIGELAKFGVQRDDRRGVTLTESDRSESPARTPPAFSRELGHSPEDVLDAALGFGPHMIRQRGAKFQEALSELQGRIMKMLDEVPDGGVVNMADMAKRLEPEGFDIREVMYALALMQETGSVENVISHKI